MRRGFIVMAVVAIVVAIIVALRPDSATEQPTLAIEEPQTFTPVSVLATAGEGLTLTGVVRDAAGAPIAGARVSLAASSQQSLTSARCGVCNEPLLSCRAHETHRSVAAMLDAHQGALTAALTTQSDEQGHFRFEHLAGTSFTVWAQATGHGMGLRERAAPGESAEVFLPAPRTLSGQVISEAGTPLAASVRVFSRRLADPVEVVADAQGHFTVGSLGEGPFYVTATAPGHVPLAKEQVEAGPNDVRLVLSKARHLEVHLVSHGKPIDGVVRLQGWHVRRELRAKDGLAIIDGLYPDELIVSAFSGALSSVPVSAPLKSLETVLTLTLEPGGTVAVTVIDEAGQPVAEPTIELLTRTAELVTSRKLKTGELGVLGPVGAGDYQVRASSENFEAGIVPVTVKPGETSVELTLARGAMIAGKVIDEYGRPAPGVSVLIGPTSEVAVSDQDGHFHATVRSPGLYTLQAHHSDWGGGEVKVTAPKTDVELHLEPKAGVEVTVTADGRRVEGASVTLYHPTGNYRSDRPSGADGVVVMRGLMPDTYKLVASHPEFLTSELQTLTLQEGPTAKSTVALRPGSAITGQVVDTEGVPVPQVSIALGPRAAQPAITDAQGNFRIAPLRPKGVYALRVAQRGFETTGTTTAVAGGEKVRVVVKRQAVFHGRVLGAGQPLTNFRVSEVEVNSADGTFDVPLPATSGQVLVTIEAPGFEPITDARPNTPDLGTFELTRAPLVTGLVRDEVTGPVADAVVTCDSCEQSVLSGADGKFSLARPSLQHEFKLIAKKGRRSASIQVTDSRLDGLELVLKPGLQITGTAYLSNGQPAAGVEISGLVAGRMDTVSAVTNADGTYSLEAPAGSTRLTLMTPESMTRSVEPLTTILELTQSTTLDFGPSPGGATLGVLLKPAPGYALWLVRGDVRSVGDPPMELLHSAWAQMVYFPRTERVVFGGLTPGRYTVVWADFHAGSAGGPVIVPVDVPSSGDVSVVR